MNLSLHPVETLEEALELAPRLDRFAAESLSEFRDDELPERIGAGFLERSFDAPETLVLVAEDKAGSGVRGVCVTGPLVDPLTGEVTPMIVALHVDPELRHRGVARALVSEARRRLVAAGHRTLSGRAGHNDDALISMGERWGFVRQWEVLLLE